MIDYSMFPRDQVICLDFKSFYASIEAVSRGLDPLTCFLVVVGDVDRSGSVVLASSPKMKSKYRIKTGNRLFEIPSDPQIHIVNARMQHYLNVSTSITQLLYQFAPLEAIHTYSVDESWINLNGSEKLFGSTWEAAEKIRRAIYNQFGLPTCIGIGPNKLLSKVILDTEGKKKGIAECQYEDVPNKLWPLPVKEMWGIGSRMERNLNRIGIRTVGHIANYSLAALKKRFGVMGEQLYYHAHGIDLSPSHYHPAPERKGFGHGITLLRDYTDIDEIRTVILELSEEVTRRAREAKLAGRTINLGIGYSRQELQGGFHRSRSVTHPTNITMDVYRVCLELLRDNYTEGAVVRNIHVSLSNLSSDSVIQLDLFDNKQKHRDIGYVMDKIRAKYGSAALLRAKSYTSGGTSVYRSKTVGGHRA